MPEKFLADDPDPRTMTGLFADLTEAQKALAVAHRGPDTAHHIPETFVASVNLSASRHVRPADEHPSSRDLLLKRVQHAEGILTVFLDVLRDRGYDMSREPLTCCKNTTRQP